MSLRKSSAYKRVESRPKERSTSKLRHTRSAASFLPIFQAKVQRAGWVLKVFFHARSRRTKHTSFVRVLYACTRKESVYSAVRRRWHKSGIEKLQMEKGNELLPMRAYATCRAAFCSHTRSAYFSPDAKVFSSILYRFCELVTLTHSLLLEIHPRKQLSRNK